MRIMNFIRYLPQWGWESVVLTVKEEYYKDNPTPDSSLLKDLPVPPLVIRTESLEPKRKLKTVEPKEEFIPGAAKPSLLTRIITFLERTIFLPDVKILWAPIAIRRGIDIIKNEKIELIIVSVPDFSLLIIAYWLKRFTGCPLVLDLRDDWDENPYYRQKYWHGRKLVTYWEHKIVAIADKVILVTENSKKSYCRRYPQYANDKFVLIPNGYDPKIDTIMEAKPVISRDVFTLVHSGMLCPERVTPALYQALKEIFEQTPELEGKIKLVFLGNICSYLRKLVRDLELEKHVEFAGNFPYEGNIRQVAQAGLLLLIPSLNIPNSLPGKVYEYLAVRRPFLAITEDNVTRDFLANLNYQYIYYPDDKEGIKEAILNFYRQFCEGELDSWLATPGIRKYNRAEQTAQLAQIFEQVREKYVR